MAIDIFDIKADDHVLVRARVRWSPSPEDGVADVSCEVGFSNFYAKAEDIVEHEPKFSVGDRVWDGDVRLGEILRVNEHIKDVVVLWDNSRVEWFPISELLRAPKSALKAAE